MKKDYVIFVGAVALLAIAGAFISSPVGATVAEVGQPSGAVSVPVDNSKASSGPFSIFGPILYTNKDNQTSVAKSRSKPAWSCSNPLAKTLYRAGFRGENLHEAWAIAMRESHGIEDEISNGVDVGLFQFNYPSWGKQPWWDWNLLQDADYNAEIAFKISKGGSDWAHWGLDGNGNPAPYIYLNIGWSEWRIQNWIVIPYETYYQQYPC